MVSGSVKAGTLGYKLREGVVVSKRDNYFIADNWEPVGVSDQFMENAEVYHELRTIDFSGSMQLCLQLAGIDCQAELSVLDIGSGSGGSVFALAKLARNARIVASDISQQLLTMLGREIEGDDALRDRVSVCCFDLHKPFFDENQFDLIVGWAILHHLADPLAALQNVVAALKPGGKLLLNEPFEAGNMLLYTMYERIIKHLVETQNTQGPLIGIMRAMRFDLQHRLGVPVLKPWTMSLDDKWFFNEPYLMELCEQLDLSSVRVYPGTDGLGNLYEATFRSLLQETGNAGLDVDEGIWDIIHEYDRGIRVELKARLAPGGFIIFTKGGGPASNAVAAAAPTADPVSLPDTAHTPTWKRQDDSFGTEAHWRSEFALAMPNSPLRAASSIADLGMFLSIGEAWAQVAARFMPVRDPVVVDIGAGCAKMGRFLMIDPGLRYIGLDVLESAMNWCRVEFGKVYPDRAQFIHLDVYSSLYNSGGRMQADNVTLPLEDASADFVICGSLFTHLLEPEMHRYLQEVARILRPGGRLLASIHIEPPEGTQFGGDARRIDMNPAFFTDSCAAAHLNLRQYVGNIYGQEVYLFEKSIA